MLRIIASTSLLLAGCPDEAAPAAEEPPTDLLAGEGTEWSWGASTCVVYMRDPGHAYADARWFDGNRLVRSGELSGRDISADFRRGFYRTGRLAIEAGEGQGAYVRRFYYDEDERLTEIAERFGPDTRIYWTTIAYDDRGRMIARDRERPSAAPLDERWTYSAFGALDSYTAESNGRPERGFLVTRGDNLVMQEVRSWIGTSTTIHRYEYAGGRITRVEVVTDAQPPREITYEYDAQQRIVARTVAPAGTDEAGQRTELVYGEKEVVEKRELTANGFLRERSIYERSENRDVRIATDTNLDGEPDRFSDLRDECGGGAFVPAFAAVFSPRIEIAGQPPYRAEPDER